jgi:hypothetical protein
VDAGSAATAVWRGFFEGGEDVLNVTHLGRGPRLAQRIALLWATPACTVLGCSRRHGHGIEHDHRTPWAQVHQTTLDNLGIC